MISQQDAERGLVYGLIRRPGEPADDALERFATLPIAVEPEDIADLKLRALYQVILENAFRDLATSTRLAAQATGIDEFDIAEGAADTDLGALPVYAQGVSYHSQRRQIGQAAEDIGDIARQATPEEALDQMQERLSDVSLGDERTRIASITERSEYGERALRRRQESMKAGEIRVDFPIAAMNDLLPYILAGQMILMTGQTKVGKSSFSGQVFDYNVRRGQRGLYFHFEDTPEVMDLRRIARMMVAYGRQGVTLAQLLGNVLSDRQQQMIDEVRAAIATWGDLGKEIYCAGWTMEKVVRIWMRECTRARVEKDPIKFVVVDYLNKAEILPAKMKDYGIFGARGRDAELVKRAAEATGVVAFLVQQEGIDGNPFETKQSAQKSQAWISLQRDRLPDYSLALEGRVVIKNANMGKTGAIDISFDPTWMSWRDIDDNIDPAAWV